MKTRSENITGIVEYYRKSGWLYRHFWDRGGLHHGLFDAKTESHREAVENQYRTVIQEGQINKRMRVLDVGCGVGDGACFIAKNTGAKVVGITIVPDQVMFATKIATKMKIDTLVEFKHMNFQQMEFRNNYFDVVYGIESVSHSPDKMQFLSEAKRVLKRGGRLIISDGYLVRQPKTLTEVNYYNQLLDGWHMYELLGIGKMLSLILKKRFTLVKKRNYGQKISRSLTRMKILTTLGRIVPIGQGVRDNTLGMLGWVGGVGAKLFGYYLLVVEKA